MRRPLPLLLALCLIASEASAAVTPHPGSGDPHIQVVDYDADQVVVLNVAMGYALTVAFSPDEQIENVSVGNSAAWQVAADKGANRLFIKPTGGMTQTDMTVVTDTRAYAFELQPQPSPNPTMPFLVRFAYPAAPQASPQPSGQAEVVTYRFGGAHDLRPSAMTDDGQTTSISWPDKTAIPATFMIPADGQPSLANGVMQEGRYVIQGIAPRYEFRAHGKTAYATRQVKTAIHR